MPTTILDGETYTDALQRRYSEEVKTDKRMNIIELAKKACAPNQTFNSDPEWVERFFNLAFAAGAAHERNKYLDKLAEAIDLSVKAEREACLACYSPDDTATDWADKIRARGEK